MDTSDPVLMARYPFTRFTSGYLRKRAPSLSDLLFARAHATARELGERRLLDAIRSGVVPDRGVVSDDDAPAEMLSYVMARILASCVGDPFLARRLALGEGKLAYGRLQGEERDVLVGIARDLDITVLEGKRLGVPMVDYLGLSAGLKTVEWKLANQDLHRGEVHMEERVMSRLLQEAVVRRCLEGMPVPVPEELKMQLKDPVDRVRTALAELRESSGMDDSGPVSITFLPPCMKELISMIQRGDNVSHSGRFALAAFLHHIGMSTEDILAVFSGTSDYIPHQARYQIEHITGEISGTEYTPPDCTTMRTYGICFNRDGLCRQKWLTHPLKYYRTKVRSAKKKVEAEPEKEEHDKVDPEKEEHEKEEHDKEDPDKEDPEKEEHEKEEHDKEEHEKEEHDDAT